MVDFHIPHVAIYMYIHLFVYSEVTLLHLPADVVRECASVDAGCPGFNKEVMLNWCVKRYLSTTLCVYDSGH